jgi:hypothetical protein
MIQDRCPLPSAPTHHDDTHRAGIGCLQQWQDAELAMTRARRCFEGWRQASGADRPSTAIRHAYHTHEALHEAARALSLLIETFRVEAMPRATTPAGSPVLPCPG